MNFRPKTSSLFSPEANRTCSFRFWICFLVSSNAFLSLWISSFFWDESIEYLTIENFSNVEKSWCKIREGTDQTTVKRILFCSVKNDQSLNMWEFLHMIVLRGKSLGVKNPTNFRGRGSFTNCNCFNNLQGNNSNSSKGN